MSPIDPLAAGSERVELAPPAPAPAARGAATESPTPEARPGHHEAVAVSLTQVGLVGRAMIGLGPPPAPADVDGTRATAVAPAGAPRRVERVLEPWGVAMLPDDAALRAWREARAATGKAGGVDRTAVATEARTDTDAQPDAVPAPGLTTRGRGGPSFGDARRQDRRPEGGDVSATDAVGAGDRRLGAVRPATG